MEPDSSITPIIKYIDSKPENFTEEMIGERLFNE